MSISIRSLNKIYPNGNHALKDITMEIPTGYVWIAWSQRSGKVHPYAYPGGPYGAHVG